MADTLSALPSTGEVVRIFECNPIDCELEWRIPDFVSLMKEDMMHFSPPISFGGAVWRMCIDIESIHLNAGIIRETMIPPVTLEVSVGFKTLYEFEKKDRERCTEHGARDGCEAYISFNCLQKTELLKRMSDLLPTNNLIVMCTLKVQEATDERARKCGSVSICGLIWPAGYVSYFCRTCETSPDVAFCPDCFKRGNHEGHDFCMYRSPAGGYCDCGDNTAMKESGFCPRHGLKNQMNMPEALPDLLFVNEVLMPRLFSKLAQQLRNNNKSDKSCASASASILQEHKVLNDFKELFHKKEDCDVHIKVQGQEFQAHKAILKARSPVLASTFRNDMKEKVTGVLEIEDCDPSSFSDFLCFLYCGDMEIISQENVVSLFITADKYDVQDLRAECVEFMKENLCVDIFCDTLSLALRHSQKELIKSTTDFFIKNAPKIIVTPKWQSFSAENPTESNELFIKLLVPKDSNLSK